MFAVNARPLIAVAALAGMLGACSVRQEPMVTAKICYDFKPAAAAPAAGDAAAPVEDCIRRWAYSLAPSRDDAETVAAASVAACRGALGRWNQASLQAPAGGEAVPTEALSITTGQPTSAIAEHYAFAEARALLFVVQARAGRCSPPPISNGQPTGVQS